MATFRTLGDAICDAVNHGSECHDPTVASAIGLTLSVFVVAALLLLLRAMPESG